jgi:hypothetical protein
VAKPPKSTHHSDINGVREDRRSNIDAAIEAGHDSTDLERARKESRGRPPYSDDKKGRDDRAG